MVAGETPDSVAVAAAVGDRSPAQALRTTSNFIFIFFGRQPFFEGAGRVPLNLDDADHKLKHRNSACCFRRTFAHAHSQPHAFFSLTRTVFMMASTMDTSPAVAKRKPIQNDDDAIRNSLDQQPKRQHAAHLFHYVSEDVDDEAGCECRLVSTAGAAVADPYDWTCEDCRTEFASDDPSVRQHCDAHDVDVCQDCYEERVILDCLEVVEQEEQDMEDAGSCSLVEDAAAEDDDPIESDDDDDVESDGSADSGAESDVDSILNDATDEDQQEEEKEDSAGLRAQRMDRQAAAEVRRLMDMELPLSDEARAQLAQLWSERPRSLVVAIDLVTAEYQSSGRERVPIEADAALLILLLEHLTTSHAPALLRGLKQLLANQHEQLFAVLSKRVIQLFPGCMPTQQPHDTSLLLLPWLEDHVRSTRSSAIQQQSLPLPGPSQAEVEALERAADEADAQAEREADAADEATEEDLAFLTNKRSKKEMRVAAQQSSVECGHALTQVVDLFAAACIMATHDPNAAIEAGVIYAHFCGWFEQHYPDQHTPSNRAFGMEFQQLFPDKERSRVVSYLGIMLR